LLTVLETGKSKIKVPADLSSGEGPLLHRYHLTALSSHGRREGEALLSLFNKSIYPIWGLHLHDLTTSERPYLFLAVLGLNQALHLHSITWDTPLVQGFTLESHRRMEWSIHQHSDHNNYWSQNKMYYRVWTSLRVIYTIKRARLCWTVC
jgi:hypothetical protein